MRITGDFPDLHANLAALEAATAEAFDRLICLGDLVGYGPAPERGHQVRQGSCLRGDPRQSRQALALDVDCQCSPPNKALAEATLAYHRTLLEKRGPGLAANAADLGRIQARRIPLCRVHATPRDQLYGYGITPELPDEQLRGEIEGVKADFILVGHTHLPMVRGIGSRVVVNPGSVGQPRDGIPEASYAIIEDGMVELKRCAYDLDRTIGALRNLPLKPEILSQLIALLEQGGCGTVA